MKTLRMLFPQWQGGNVPDYAIGARLLEWLAPDSVDAITVEVPVDSFDGASLAMEDGVLARAAIKKQLRSAVKILDTHQPDRIIVFGGDCHVSHAPFTYLNSKYRGSFGVLWLDTHPDVSTPDMHTQENAMVLGNLLGEGDPDFSNGAETRLPPGNVMFGGLRRSTLSAGERAIVDRLGIAIAEPAELITGSEKVLHWIEARKIIRLAIHLDLDVLDPRQFRAQLPANPEGPVFTGAVGSMTFSHIARIIKDAATRTELVGLTLAEHIPWDAIHLRNFMAGLAIFQSG